MDTDPFTMTKIGNQYFGRGVADDKGAAVVSLYCLKVLQDEQVVTKRRIRTIFGAGEETGSDDLERYFEKEPMPVMGTLRRIQNMEFVTGKRAFCA